MDEDYSEKKTSDKFTRRWTIGWYSPPIRTTQSIHVELVQKQGYDPNVTLYIGEKAIACDDNALNGHLNVKLLHEAMEAIRKAYKIRR